jgi:hypothetical protein
MRLPIAQFLPLLASERHGRDSGGTLTFSCGGALVGRVMWLIVVSQGAPYVTLSYYVNRNAQSQMVAFSSSLLYGGGLRWWYRCPCCYRRCGVLFFVGRGRVGSAGG